MDVRLYEIYKVSILRGEMNVSTANQMLDVTLERQQSNVSSMVDDNDTLQQFYVARHPSIPLEWYSIMNMIILSVILCGSSLNLLILRFIQHNKHMRTPFNMMISAILIANLLRAGVIITMELVETYNNFSIQGRVYCILKVLLRGCMYGLSLVITTAIAIMRAYVCVKTVLIKIKTSIALTVIAIAFLLATLLVVPYLLPGSQTQNTCLALMPLGGEGFHRFYPALRSILVLLLFFVVFASYLTIALYIRVKKRNFKVVKTELFTLKGGVILSLVFLITYIPPYLGVLVVWIPRVLQDQFMLLAFTRLFSLLTLIDTAIMPLTLILQNRDLKNGIKSMMFKMTCPVSLFRNAAVMPMTTRSENIEMCKAEVVGSAE